MVVLQIVLSLELLNHDLVQDQATQIDYHPKHTLHYKVPNSETRLAIHHQKFHLHKIQFLKNIKVYHFHLLDRNQN